MGVEIWEISFEDFVALDTVKQNTSEKIYLITNDNKVITKGQVFGNVTKDRKRLNTIPRAVAWQVAYARQLTLLNQKNEIKKQEVVVERPTIESLANEAEKNLKEVKHEAENQVKDLAHDGEMALNEVVEKAEDKVQEILEVAVENSVKMEAESKAVLEKLAEEGAKKAEAIQAKNTTVPRRKRKTTTTEDVLKALQQE